MIVIIGAGVSGLSLSYFLSSAGIKNLVIDMRKDVGKNYRSTSLVSSKIFDFLDFLKESDIVIKKINTASFWYSNEKLLEVKSSSGMYLTNYLKLESEIYNQTDKNYSKFGFGEEVLDVNLEKNFLVTNKRRVNFDFLVDASGPYSFIANRFNLFKHKKVYNSFEVFSKLKNSNFIDANIFFDKNFSKSKFGWLIEVGENSLIGLIDFRLRLSVFKKFLEKFEIERIEYSYSHPILYCELKKHSLKNCLIIGEASGLLKPFSFGGITYGIISAYLAYKSIKSNCKENYEKKLKKIFCKPILIGKFADIVIKRKKLVKLANILKVETLLKNFDPDFIY
ncbi:MAG: NAD(P)/FAD-dependent oxidoreductase [Candidatus Aenigmatarchaeota archaeon]